MKKIEDYLVIDVKGNFQYTDTMTDIQETVTNTTTNIFRYKFTDYFMNELHVFSKIHQYDERKDFKEAWEQWILENDMLVSRETERLTTLGYEGDVVKKMFTSARYYFRKKSSEKKEPKVRRQYISASRELIQAVDNHIKENSIKPDYQPKTGFADFCNNNTELIKAMMAKYAENGELDVKEIHDKVKKTYKNRYFMFASK